ncbi:MAG TPA: AAA family ATPase [Ohtaekwangia sp.]|nr:AAA family ATPase [Ohtaekwangia sp.]
MERDPEHDVYQARQRVVTKMAVSDQLDGFVQQMKANHAPSLCGVLVSGYTGTGKTFLVENYLQEIDSSHPVLIARHHQQHQNIPYFGFKYCISDYLGKIYNQSSTPELHSFSDRLKEYLGESFFLLVDYVPELSLIFGRVAPLPVRSHLTIENQLYPLFKRLFEFLSDFYNRPVFFFTDDLQWIDVPGINLLKYLLLNLSNQKLVWIGACRAPQNKTSLLRQLIEELRVKEIRVENLLLKGLNTDEVHLFAEMTLNGKCHRGLTSTCYKLTEGNPSHLQALLDHLRSGDLIWQEGGVWHCDAVALKAQYEGRNAQYMLLEQVAKLSPAAYDVLCIMACMGRFNRQIILDWLQGDIAKMKMLLAEGVDAGVLEPYEQEVRFSEMNVGEMIYNQLPEGRKLDLHYTIANLLYSRGLERLNSTDIILMATSFNQSLDRVKADGRLQLAAQLNYKAGKFLQQDKAYDRARYFFKMSAEILKECPWEEVSEQVWLVYMDRARTEYYLGEYDLAEIHLDYLIERITMPLKRARVFELKVTINNHLARYQKVVWILKESLAELGVELPLDEQPLHDEVKRLKAILAQRETDPGSDSAAQQPLEPDYSESILRLLYVGGMSLHHTSDVLMTWAALQIILRANREKPSVVKAIGYVSYGRMLIISGDIEKGYEFGTKGLTINQSMDDITLRCRVFGVFAFYIQPWMKDFSESSALLEEAARAGRKAGDLIGIYILKTHQLNLHLISGLPLKGLSQWDFEESYPGMELTYYITHYQKSLIRFLMGETTVFSIPRQNPSSLAGRLTIQEEKFYRHYVWARYYFLFGHYDLAARSAEEAHANRKLQEASPLLPANLVIWFLSVTQNWYSFSRETREGLAVRIRDVLQSFASWKNTAPGNYRPAWLLLNAEWCRINGKGEEALQWFQESFDASSSNIYHRAITSELWAKFLLTRNIRDVRACELLSDAIASFEAWGAVAKSKQLMQQFEALLSGFLQSIDIETIQYELSGDLEVRSLVKKLMTLLLRISGSSHVVVELAEGSGDRIWYDALSLLPDVGEKQSSIPKSMILMALKSQDVVIVNELKTERALRDVDALQARGVMSFLILPVTISGHLSMVIYLENVFARNWYVPERVKAVRIAANQGAVMIENARIHEQSVKLNQEIRIEMLEKERLSSLIKAQKDAHLKALMHAQDSERKRIASDLHDSLGSLLSSVRLRFNGLQQEFLQKVPAKAQRFNDSLTLLDEAIQELRQISHNMVPVSLSRFGLNSTLQTFVAQVNASGQLDVDLQILGLEARLPEEMEVRVFRICQELVQNVIKHAQATTLRIQVILHNDALNLEVEDNGVGLMKDTLTHGFGFNTIQSSVDLFKGTFGIESQPGKGCLVLIDLPVL